MHLIKGICNDCPCRILNNSGLSYRTNRIIVEIRQGKPRIGDDFANAIDRIADIRFDVFNRFGHRRRRIDVKHEVEFRYFWDKFEDIVFGIALIRQFEIEIEDVFDGEIWIADDVENARYRAPIEQTMDDGVFSGGDFRGIWIPIAIGIGAIDARNAAAIGLFVVGYTIAIAIPATETIRHEAFGRCIGE